MKKIIELGDQMVFVPFTLAADGKTRVRTRLFPVHKHFKDAKKEIQKNPLARRMPVEYREMTRNELLILEAQEKLCLPPVIS